MSQRLDELFTVLNAIRRILEETHESIEPAVADVAHDRALVDESRADCADRALATLSMIRPDSADLASSLKTILATVARLHATCHLLISERETLGQALESIGRALANVELVPRTQNLGKAARPRRQPKKTQHLSRIES